MLSQKQQAGVQPQAKTDRRFWTPKMLAMKKFCHWKNLGTEFFFIFRFGYLGFGLLVLDSAILDSAILGLAIQDLSILNWAILDSAILDSPSWFRPPADHKFQIFQRLLRKQDWLLQWKACDYACNCVCTCACALWLWLEPHILSWDWVLVCIFFAFS